MSSRVSGQCSHEFMDGKIRSQCSILNCGVFISTLRAFISLHKWFVSSPYTTSVVSSIEYIYMDTKFKKGNSWTNWSGNKIDGYDSSDIFYNKRCHVLYVPGILTNV